MKRIVSLLAALLIIILPAAALAEETPDAAMTLEIDNTHLFEGMERTYSQGYAPKAEEGRLTVILPLKAEEDGQKLTVTPELGDPASAPFVFKSYQKSVRPMQKRAVGTDKDVWIYYIRFDFALRKDRINGTYPIVLNITGRDVAQSFTVYASISDGKDPVQESEPEKATSKPVVIVETSEVTPALPKAGEAFSVTALLRNTSAAKAVQNMTVTVSCEGGVTLEEKSGTIYIDKLAAGQSRELKLGFKADAAAIPGKYQIDIAMTYDCMEQTGAVSLSSSGSIGVQVTQPIRLEMTLPALPESVSAGETLPLSFQAMNLGRGTVYNVRCELDVPGLLPSGTAFFGNMEAGTAVNADVNVFIGTKDMSENYSGSDKYGYTSGTARIIYEDENGVEYTQEFELSTAISEPVIEETTADAEPEQMGQWWITAAIIAGAIALAAVVLIVAKRRGKHETE